MANNPVRFIAERLSDQLRTGIAPWQKVWQPGRSYLPQNPFTGQSYRAVNAVSLASAAIEAGYSDPRWMTAAQATRLGGGVQPGQGSSPVIAWQFEQRLPTGQVVKLEKPRMTVREVFNAEQIDNLPEFKPVTVSPGEAQARVAAIARNSKAGIVTDANGGASRYDPERDTILLKNRREGTGEQFAQIELVHALAHWTGHPSRLNRDLAHPIGSTGHAREEHCVNIASMILGDRLGIGWHPGTHVVLGTQWADLLEKDPTEMLRACRDAEAIAQHLIDLGREQDRTQEVEQEQERETLVARDHPAITRPDNAGKRTYLVVPFAEKDKAKEFGAKFDREHKAWYVPGHLDAALFEAWRPRQAAIHIATDSDPRRVFADNLRDAGFVLDTRHPIMDGQIHHVPVDGNKGAEKSGSYCAYADGVPNGWYQNFKIHDQPQKWVMRRTHAQTITPAVRESIKALSAQHHQDAAAARQQSYDKAAADLQRIWNTAIENAPHPYLTGKGITHADGLRVAGPNAKVTVESTRPARPAAEPWMMKPGGLEQLEPHLRASAERSYAAWAEAKPVLARRHDLADYVSYVQERWAEDERKIERSNLTEISIAGRLLVPLRNMDGQLRSLQIIDDNGQKMFARGGEVVGSHLVLGDINSPWPLHFTEGYATGKAIHDATGHAVVVTFSANNLAPVASAYRERFAERTFLIDADNDHQKARERDAQGRLKPNTGKERAEAAARLTNGHVALPPFAETDSGKDWDDYQRQHGMEALQGELTAQLAAAGRKKIAQDVEKARTYGRSTPARAVELSR